MSYRFPQNAFCAGLGFRDLAERSYVGSGAQNVLCSLGLFPPSSRLFIALKKSALLLSGENSTPPLVGSPLGSAFPEQLRSQGAFLEPLRTPGLLRTLGFDLQPEPTLGTPPSQKDMKTGAMQQLRLLT